VCHAGMIGGLMTQSATDASSDVGRALLLPLLPSLQALLATQSASLPQLRDLAGGLAKTLRGLMSAAPVGLMLSPAGAATAPPQLPLALAAHCRDPYTEAMFMRVQTGLEHVMLCQVAPLLWVSGVPSTLPSRSTFSDWSCPHQTTVQGEDCDQHLSQCYSTFAAR
jgi:hypothetical protein